MRDVAGKIKIRRAKRLDLPAMIELIHQKPEWNIRPDSVVLDMSIVAVNEVQQVVGWLMGNHESLAWTNIDGYDLPDNWKCSYIVWLLVDEQHKYRSIGSCLLHAFEEESSIVGNDTIILSPSAGAEELGVITFYEKNGYRRAESGQMHRGPHGSLNSFPLQRETSTGDGPDGLAKDVILKYKRMLGVKGY